MSGLRTKLLIWCAGLIGFLLVTPFVLPTVIPYLFAKFSANSTLFVSVHIHTAPFITWVVVWTAVVVCAWISFLYDKQRGSGQ